VSTNHHSPARARAQAAAFAALGTLRACRAFEKRHLHFLRTVEDHDIVREIGCHEGDGQPLTQKRLFLLGVGSVATIQRRLRRLRHLGAIQQRRCDYDRRAIEFTLSPRTLAVFARYGELIGRSSAQH
jgi:DNA-binding MarR family transcriptional regulator